MVRIALLQIEYKPAIIDRGVDLLAEPAIWGEGVSIFSLQKEIHSERKLFQLQDLRNRIREEYVIYITHKISEICYQTNEIYHPDLMVFPEYSIPYQCLPQIHQIANDLNIIIISGSHTVIDSAIDYYRLSNLPEEIINKYRGCSLCPIFLSRNGTYFQIKNTKSNYEPSMNTPSNVEIKKFEAYVHDGSKVIFSILICADAIEPSVLGHLPITGEDPGLIIIPAMSPLDDTFTGTEILMERKGLPVLVCNHSKYGGTGIHLPKNIRNRFLNYPGENSRINDKSEKVMILEIEQNHYFTKRQILDSTVIGRFTEYPILYLEGRGWYKEYSEAFNTIRDAIIQLSVDEIHEWIDYYTEAFSNTLPKPIISIMELVGAKITEGETDRSYLAKLLNSIILDFHATEGLFHNELDEYIKFCSGLQDLPIDLMVKLGDYRKKYQESVITPIEHIMPNRVMSAEMSQEQVASFRDRGHFISAIEKSIADENVKLILVSGAYGIGKTSAVSAAFKKSLVNWDKKMFFYSRC